MKTEQQRIERLFCRIAIAKEMARPNYKSTSAGTILKRINRGMAREMPALKARLERTAKQN